MSKGDVLPELKEILGAMIFAANRSLSAREMRKCLSDVAKEYGGETEAFGKAREADIKEALEELKKDLEQAGVGFCMSEVASGYRLQSNINCGKWLKHLLGMHRSHRLSVPALETLAIIACRQPISRVDIENIRGVNVDHVVKTLLEMQLIKIAGRSDLPGRPFLYGTTQLFFEHFGLKDLNDLGEIDALIAATTGGSKQSRGPKQQQVTMDLKEDQDES